MPNDPIITNEFNIRKPPTATRLPTSTAENGVELVKPNIPFEQLAFGSLQFSHADLITQLTSTGFTSRLIDTGSKLATLLTAESHTTLEHMLDVLGFCAPHLREGNLFIQANITSPPTPAYLETLVKTLPVEVGVIESDGSRTLITGTTSTLPLEHLGLRELTVKSRSYIHTHPLQENGENHVTPSPGDVANTFLLLTVKQAVATPEGIMEFRKPENLHSKLHFSSSLDNFFKANGCGPFWELTLAPHQFYPLFKRFLIETGSLVREARWENTSAIHSLLADF